MGTASNETIINTAVGAGSATTNIEIGVTHAEVVDERDVDASVELMVKVLEHIHELEI